MPTDRQKLALLDPDSLQQVSPVPYCRIADFGEFHLPVHLPWVRSMHGLCNVECKKGHSALAISLFKCICVPPA